MMNAVPGSHADPQVKPGSAVIRVVSVPAGILLALLLSFALSISGCASRKTLIEGYYLTKEQAYGKIVREHHGVPRGYFLLRLDQLPELREARTISYLGTDSSFHFMRVWAKMSHADEVILFAVSEDDCHVEEPLPNIPWDVQVRGPVAFWRHDEKDNAPSALPVILEDGTCRVEAWSRPKD
jgi:hypothetical protein